MIQRESLLPAEHAAKLDRNGFTFPLHFQQVASWVVYLIQITLYFTILFPTFTSAQRVSITLPYVIIFVLFNIFFVLASRTKHPSPFVIGPGTSAVPRAHCDWCDQDVSPECKHCRCCGVCRRDFDHHCFFLNNCITNSNYRWFALGITFLSISAVFTTLLCMWLLMGIAYGSGPLERAASIYGVAMRPGVAYWLCGWLLFQELGIEAFMIYLSALHILLARRGITTFELIVYRRQLEKEKAARAGR
jgi:hypothetical protein